jgi:hypothetical protein
VLIMFALYPEEKGIGIAEPTDEPFYWVWSEDDRVFAICGTPEFAEDEVRLLTRIRPGLKFRILPQCWTTIGYAAVLCLPGSIMC